MTNIFEVENLRDGYVDLVNWVKRDGKPVAPRGFKTWEIEDATFILHNPLDVMPVGVGRELHPKIGAAEALLLVAGLSDPTFMVNVSGQFARFLDGGILHGAYGWRVRPQLVNAVRRLAADPDTRQAIVTLWDPLYDSLETKDLPCTLNFGFRIRDGKLNMSVTMRSNDVWLGTAYDVFMFTQLQITMANALGVQVGTYTHHAYSLHLYERNVEATDKLHYSTDEETPAFHPVGFGELNLMPDSRLTSVAPEEAMQDAIMRARAVYEDDVDLTKGPAGLIDAIGPTESELWYADTLARFPRMRRMEGFAA